MALRLGIDLGGTKIAAVVLGPDGGVRWERRIPSPRDSYDATREARAAPAAVAAGPPGGGACRPAPGRDGRLPVRPAASASECRARSRRSPVSSKTRTRRG